MKRVTGLGGIFFKTKNPQKKETENWYERHLGINYTGSGGYPFWEWRSLNDPEKTGETVWSIFDKKSEYFGNPDQQFMVNFRVANLVELIKVLREEGITIAGEIQEFEYGKFAWILDPDGNKIELWEPAEETGFGGGMPAE